MEQMTKSAVDDTMTNTPSIFLQLKTDEARAFYSLKAALGLSDDADVLALALNILDWAVEESNKGDLIASVNPRDETYRSVEFDELETLRQSILQQLSSDAEPQLTKG